MPAIEGGSCKEDREEIKTEILKVKRKKKNKRQKISCNEKVEKNTDCKGN